MNDLLKVGAVIGLFYVCIYFGFRIIDKPLLYYEHMFEITKDYKAKDCVPNNAKWSIKKVKNKQGDEAQIIISEFKWDGEKAFLKIVKKGLKAPQSFIYLKNSGLITSDIDLGNFCQNVQSNKDILKKIEFLNSIEVMSDLKLNDFFRKKYPEYNDISEKELADTLYKKYYSGIPIDEFYKKIGFRKIVKYNQKTKELEDGGYTRDKSPATHRFNPKTGKIEKIEEVNSEKSAVPTSSPSDPLGIR